MTNFTTTITNISMKSARLDTRSIDTAGELGFMIPIEFTDTLHKELVMSIAEGIGVANGWTAINTSKITTFISIDFYVEALINQEKSTRYRLYVDVIPLDKNEMGCGSTCEFVPIELSETECNHIKQIMTMQFAKLLIDC